MKESVTYENLSASEKNFQNLTEFLGEIDVDLNPKLSARVNLGGWAEKILNKGFVIAAIHDTSIIGISAFYCSPKRHRYAFYALWAVLSRYRGAQMHGAFNSIGLELYKRTVLFCKNKGMDGIDSIVSARNEGVLRFHSAFGAQILEELVREENDLAYRLRTEF